MQPLRSLSDKITTCATKHLAIRKNLIRLADPNVIIKVDTRPEETRFRKGTSPHFFQLRSYFSTVVVLHSCVLTLKNHDICEFCSCIRETFFGTDTLTAKQQFCQKPTTSLFQAVSLSLESWWKQTIYLV